jgi:hypothetical protein
MPQRNKSKMPRLEDLELQIKQTSASASGIKNITDALGRLASSARATSTSAKAIKSLGDSMKSVSSSGVASQIKATSEQMEKMSTGASEAAKGVESFKKTVKTATRHTSGFGKSLLTTPWNAFKSKIVGVLKPLSNLYNSFKRIAMYRALRTALKEITQGFAIGVKHLYAWAGLVGNSFVGTMDSLATSMNYLRNSLGAMISPLLDALAPAVDILVDKFVDLINLVNQFFATMTGATSWRKALKTQKEYADNTDDAAKAQARLNHQLMAFDELNNISVSNPSGRGGGGNNDDVSADDFEEVPLPDWAKSIKDAIDRGDWAGAGEALADKLNGIIEDWDSYSAGQLLGQKINNVLSFYVSFMDKFDWAELGKKFAGYVNGVFNNIDPQTLGQAMVAHIKAAFEFLANFLPNVDVTNIALAFSTAINELFSDENAVNVGKTIAGVINKGIEFLKTMITGGYIEKRIPGTDKVIREWVDGIDFKQAGYGIFEAIGTAIKNIKWEDLGTVIQNLAGGLVDMVSGAFDYMKEHPSDVTDAIKDFFSGLWGENGEGALKLIKATGLILGFKLAFGAVFGDAGLISTAKTAFTTLLSDAGISNVVIACAIGLVWGISEIVDNCKQYGVDRGLWMSLSVADPEMIAKLGLDTTGFVNSFSSAWDWFVGELGVIGPVLKALGIELPDNIPGITKPSNSQSSTNNSLVTGLYEAEKILEKMSKKTYNITINDKNRMLETSAANAETLVGNTGLGGIKAAYNSKVTTGGLADSKRDAVNYGKALLAVDNKTFSTTVKSSGLTGNTNNSSTYKSNLAWLDKKIATSTFKANGLSTSKTDSTTYKNNAAAVSGKTFSSTFKAPGLSGNKSSVETFKDNAFAVKGQTFSTTFKTTGLESNAGYADDMKSALTSMNGKKYSTTLTTSGISQAETSTSNITKNLDYATSKPWKIKAEFSYQSSLPPGVLPGVGGMASGGFPPVGSAFIAGEAGPELVGTINGRTGVVSANEISGIGDAIYDTGETEAALLQQLLAVGRQLLAKSGNVTLAPNAAAGRWVAQSQAAYARATGG